MLELVSNSIHLSVLYAGFELLRRQHGMRLHVEARESYRSHYAGLEMLTVRCDGGPTVLFDTSDVTDRPVSEALLNGVDVIFRRMCSSVSAGTPRIEPLGPCYAAFCGNLWRDRWRYCRTWRDRIRLAIRETRILGSVSPMQVSAATTSLDKLQIRPGSRQRTGVLFAAGLWDPDLASTPELAAERHALNAQRIAVARALKSSFGNDFIGGIRPSAFSAAQCPDVLVSARASRHGAFLRSRRHAAIGVATTGLQGSLGWKFAEYLAAGMAIVTEPVGTLLPGPIAAETHYRTFTQPDECVAAVMHLRQHPGELVEMMQRNYSHFGEYVRPDRMVARALALAGSHARMSSAADRRRDEGLT